MNETKIKTKYQDRNSEAWNKLCAYIEKVEKAHIVKMTVAEFEDELRKQTENQEKEPVKLLKLIRKIWEK